MNAEHDISTPLVRAFTFAWASIQARNPDVPNVVITLGAGSSRQGTVLGHFAPNRWARGDSHIHELFVGGEGLQRGAPDVMATLLHEAAHGVALARDIQDVSRSGRYHNKAFKALGEELGISLAHDTRKNGIGWSNTTLTDEAAKTYAAAIRRLDAAMVAYRRGERTLAPTGNGEGGPEGKGRGRPSMGNGVALTCECEIPRKIRVSKSTAEMGAIRCELCGSKFLERG